MFRVSSFVGALLLLIASTPLNAAEDEYVGIGAMFKIWERGTVVCTDCSPELTRELEKDAKIVLGVEISELACDGPAAKAGLKIGDWVTAIEDVFLVGKSPEDVSKAIDAIRQGGVAEVVKITIERDGVPEQFDVHVARAAVSPSSLVSDCN